MGIAGAVLAVAVARWPSAQILCDELSRRSFLCCAAGLPWRMLPPCFRRFSTVRRWFYLWRDNRLWQTLNPYLLMAWRVANGREQAQVPE